MDATFTGDESGSDRNSTSAGVRRWRGSRFWLNWITVRCAVGHGDLADPRRRRVVNEGPQLPRRGLAGREAQAVERLAAVRAQVVILVDHAADQVLARRQRPEREAAARVRQPPVGQAVGQQQRLDQRRGRGRLGGPVHDGAVETVLGSGAPVVNVSVVPVRARFRRRSVTPGSSSTR